MLHFTPWSTWLVSWKAAFLYLFNTLNARIKAVFHVKYLVYTDYLNGSLCQCSYISYGIKIRKWLDVFCITVMSLGSWNPRPSIFLFLVAPSALLLIIVLQNGFMLCSHVWLQVHLNSVVGVIFKMVFFFFHLTLLSIFLVFLPVSSWHSCPAGLNGPSLLFVCLAPPGWPFPLRTQLFNQGSVSSQKRPFLRGNVEN